jgi:solute carrier family 25 (mitochondrial 2-oxodicarboxylate transporter), member 21
VPRPVLLRVSCKWLLFPRFVAICQPVLTPFSVVPFELVKIRLQDKASAGKYSGMLDVVAKTVRNEGVLAMYQGLESTLWRHILWNAGYFGCIFQVRQLLPKADTKRSQMLNDILAGSIGGTVGTLVNTPMYVSPVSLPLPASPSLVY